MNLDDVRVTRRGFLKIAGSLFVTAAVPGLRPVTMPAQGQGHRYEVVVNSHQWAPGDSVLWAPILLPHDAGDEGSLSLYWTGGGAVGCWADYVEVHVGPGGQILSAAAALPEKVIPLQATRPGSVAVEQLGKIHMIPGRVLLVGICGGVAYMPGGSLEPWDIAEDVVSILGIDLKYDTV